jgi:hypothetical protein
VVLARACRADRRLDGRAGARARPASSEQANAAFLNSVHKGSAPISRLTVLR